MTLLEMEITLRKTKMAESSCDTGMSQDAVSGQIKLWKVLQDSLFL